MSNSVRKHRQSLGKKPIIVCCSLLGIASMVGGTDLGSAAPGPAEAPRLAAGPEWADPTPAETDRYVETVLGILRAACPTASASRATACRARHQNGSVLVRAEEAVDVPPSGGFDAFRA